MEELDKLVESWNIELSKNQPNYQLNNLRRDRKFSIEKNGKNYNDLLNEIKFLIDFKFEPYLPVKTPPSKEFIERLVIWLDQFNNNEKRYLFYLVSKIIFFNSKQINHLYSNVYEKKIKRVILEDIIKEKQSIPPFDYKTALKFYQEEIKKTIFVGLTDSSRINEFSHVINQNEINRDLNFGLSLDTILYPSKKRTDIFLNSHQNMTPEEEKKISICEEFEDKILATDEFIMDKKRIVILEDFCGSGSDVREKLNLLKNSNLTFEKIILAPFIITYKGLDNINNWILQNNIEGEIEVVFGEIIPEKNKCFDFKDNYLEDGWFEKENISEKIKEISESYYNNVPFDSLTINDKFGFGSLYIAFVNYFNCPDNSLPLIWIDDHGWKPLFARSRRIL